MYYIEQQPVDGGGGRHFLITKIIFFSKICLKIIFFWGNSIPIIFLKEFLGQIYIITSKGPIVKSTFSFFNFMQNHGQFFLSLRWSEIINFVKSCLGNIFFYKMPSLPRISTGRGLTWDVCVFIKCHHPCCRSICRV